MFKNKRGSNQYVKRIELDMQKQMEQALLVTILLIVIALCLLGACVQFVRSHNKPIKIISPLADQIHAQEIVTTPSPTPSMEELREKRIKKIHTYLLERNSPLAGYATQIVSMADKYDIPWTLVTAIAGKESSYGKNIKAGSFNAWGIMAWDAHHKRIVMQFASWDKSIEYASQLLSAHYRTNMNKAIQEKYCPTFECSETWVSDVTSFQEEINK